MVLEAKRLHVSVVIPARNAHATLARAVTSAVNQVQPPTEIIVVDDGSTDGTEVVLRELGLMAACQTGGIGVAGARNSGVQRATGAWIAFLDADDFWAPDFLAAAYGAVARCPSSVACFAAADHVDEAGKFVARPRLRTAVTLEDLVRGRVVPTTSATLVRRDAFLRFGAFFEGFESPSGCEDIDLWFRMAYGGPCVGQPSPLATYVVHDVRDADRAHENLEKLERDRELVIERLEARGASSELVAAGRAVMRARTGRYWLRAGYSSEARRAARASLRARPTREGVLTLALSSLPQAVRDPARRFVRRLRAKATY